MHKDYKCQHTVLTILYNTAWNRIETTFRVRQLIKLGMHRIKVSTFMQNNTRHFSYRHSGDCIETILLYDTVYITIYVHYD